jgi:hypothetical protein
LVESVKEESDERAKRGAFQGAFEARAAHTLVPAFARPCRRRPDLVPTYISHPALATHMNDMHDTPLPSDIRAELLPYAYTHLTVEYTAFTAQAISDVCDLRRARGCAVLIAT